MEAISNRYNYDLLGAIVSGLCAVHCTLTPVLFAVRPVLDSTLEKHAHGGGFWAVFDYVFLVFSFIAIWFSTRYYTRTSFKRVLWAAWVVFAIGLLTEPLDFWASKYLMYAGSLSLIFMHLRNYQDCQKV